MLLKKERVDARLRGRLDDGLGFDATPKRFVGPGSQFSVEISTVESSA